MTNTQITAADQRRLTEARNSFLKRLNSLSERQQRAVVATTAQGGVFGDADPYTIAIAAQMEEVFKANERITTLKAELAEVEGTNLSGYRPNDPDFRGRMLVRAEDLKQQIALEAINVMGIAEDDLQRAQVAAVEHFRQLDVDAAKNQAIATEAERLSAEADAAAIRGQALALANSRRVAEGKPRIEAEDA
jgi:hypothetical protein